AAAESDRGRQAHAERKDDRGKSVEESVATGGYRDEAFKPRLVDLDFPGGGRNYLALVDQEGFGRIGSDRHLAGNGNPGTIKNPAADFDAMRAFGVKALPRPEIEQT